MLGFEETEDLIVPLIQEAKDTEEASLESLFLNLHSSLQIHDRMGATFEQAVQ